MLKGSWEAARRRCEERKAPDTESNMGRECDGKWSKEAFSNCASDLVE